MSDNAPAAVSELVTKAIERAVGEALHESGGLLTGHIALATFLNADGVRCWSMAVGAGQSMFESRGMCEFLTNAVDVQLLEHLQ